MSSKIISILAIILILVGLKIFYSPGSNLPSVESGYTSEPIGSKNLKDESSKITTSNKDISAGGETAEMLIPATQKYTSATEALEAIRKAAVDYDDVILASFNNLKNCPWCDEFYLEVEKMAADPSINLDQRAFFAEVMSGSGDVEVMGQLIKLFESTSNLEDKEMFGEAIEMAEGGDDMVQLLSSYLTNPDSTLRESAVSAISNQGSRLAVETLYKDMISGGGVSTDYYAMGTGLPETVPDETAIPYLHELLIQRAPKSEHVIKALLNAGMDGVTVVFDALSSENDEAKGKQLLTDATEHIITDDEVVNFLTKASVNQNYPNFLREFAREALAEAQSEDLEDEEDF